MERSSGTFQNASRKFIQKTERKKHSVGTEGPKNGATSEEARKVP